MLKNHEKNFKNFKGTSTKPHQKCQKIKNPLKMSKKNPVKNIEKIIKNVKKT